MPGRREACRAALSGLDWKLKTAGRGQKTCKGVSYLPFCLLSSTFYRP